MDVIKIMEGKLNLHFGVQHYSNPTRGNMEDSHIMFLNKRQPQLFV
jgi:hypothetical protein